MAHVKSANAARGEAQIICEESLYILRPSFGALAAAEGEIGSLFDFVERAANGQAKLSEVVAIFWHCVIADNDLDRDQFSDELMQIGMVGLTPVLKIILRQILQGQ